MIIFVNPNAAGGTAINHWKKAERFRVSLMATHTREDIDRLVGAVQEVWKEAENASPSDT